MGDEGRGTVWEEIIVNAPHDVQLVALSATVANVKEIADWISIVHGPIIAVYHPQRPVPLAYAVADLAGDIHDMARVRDGRARLIGDESRGADARGRWYTRRVVDPVVLIEALEGRGWLPGDLLHLQPGRVRARGRRRAHRGSQLADSGPAPARSRSLCTRLSAIRRPSVSRR